MSKYVVDAGSNVNAEWVSLTSRRLGRLKDNLRTKKGLRQFTWPIEILHDVSLLRCRAL
jgi:hypothetical protein